jgi:YVTN family beta-propeller protein
VVDFASRKETARIELPKPDARVRNRQRAEFRAVARHRRHAGQQDTVGDQHPEQRGVRLFARRPEDGRQVALPALKLPGHEAISAVANWVTFTPDSKTIYVSNAGSRSVTAIDVAAMKVKASCRSARCRSASIRW